MRLRGRGPGVSVVPAVKAPPLWSDEFDGPVGQLPSASNWGYNIGRWGASSGENQYYTNSPSNVSLDGASCLALTVRNEVAPDAAAAPMDYTSARIVSKDKREFGPGAGPIRIASRIKLPYAKGLLPAFWTIGAGDDWPEDGEIDFLEQPTHVGPNYLAMNLHGPTAGNPSADKNIGRGWRSPDALGATFRTYGVDWYPDRILWHVDGVVRGVTSQADYAAINGDWAPFSGATEHYLILCIAVGNNWTGDPDGSGLPATMLIDWVRVWPLT